MNIKEKLLYVQQNLNAPKNQYNSFGKYKYRSCEDILEALKKPLSEVKAAVVISDELVMVGNRNYVKAEVKFVDVENDGECVVNTAFAREAETKKGMDEAQITGATSSYARKYCLSGLFLIDDQKDFDTNELKEESSKKQKAGKGGIESMRVDLRNLINRKIKEGDLDKEAVLDILGVEGVTTPMEITTKEQYDSIKSAVMGVLAGDGFGLA